MVKTGGRVLEPHRHTGILSCDFLHVDTVFLGRLNVLS